MAFWDGKRVLVTGAGGFVGSHLVEELVGLGSRVTALVHYNSRNDWSNLDCLDAETRESMEVVGGDVRDPFFTDQIVQGQAVVLHLAAQIAIPYSYIAPAEFVETNVRGTLNVLQACVRHGIEKLLHTSTSETYGSAQYTPMDERHPLCSQSPYAASKIGADKLVESYCAAFDARAATIRPFNIYGPRQSARAVIPTIIGQLAAGRTTIQLGSLHPVRDLTFVKDTVRAFVLMVESPETVGQVINVGTGKGISVGALAELIAEVMGIEVTIRTTEERKRPEKSEVTQLICNSEKARSMLGWQPRVSLRSGLEETVNHVTGNLQRYKADIYNV